MTELIPAIDLIDGRCVRLTQGDYNQEKCYSDSPLEIARSFESAGVRRLHLVDLDGARASHVVNLKVLEALSTNTNLTIDFGGGIKSHEDLKLVFSAGASMVTIGSLAVKSPNTLHEWISEYGSDRFIIGTDIRDGKLSINGWKEDIATDLTDFINGYISHGVRRFLCTDISRDGMLQGPSTALYCEIMRHHPNMELIASGGVSSMEDIHSLDSAGINSVVFGKAFYEGRISLIDIRDYISKKEKSC